MLNNWQVYVTDVITGRKTGLLAFMLRGCLQVLSWGYQVIVVCRNWAFDRRYFRRYSPPVPLVISVGNIVAGGTGKTPVTLMLAQEFYPDIPIAILSRGYKSRAEKKSEPIFLSNGNGPLYRAEFCGDEPYLIAQHLPKAIVIVGKNRYVASNMAAQAGAQVILLDDGLQHRHLERDLDLIVVNALDVFGQGYFLPRGFLRENKKALSRANLLIINHVENEEQFQSVKAKLAPYTQAAAVGTRMELFKIWSCSGQALDTITEKKLGLFCGIAHPLQFQKTVQAHGALVVDKCFLSDHSTLSVHDLVTFAEKCKKAGAEALICTEKDYVKISKPTQLCLPIIWLQMRLAVVCGESNWRTFISQAKSSLLKRM